MAKVGAQSRAISLESVESGSGVEFEADCATGAGSLVSFFDGAGLASLSFGGSSTAFSGGLDLGLPRLAFGLAGTGGGTAGVKSLFDCAAPGSGVTASAIAGSGGFTGETAEAAEDGEDVGG